MCSMNRRSEQEQPGTAGDRLREIKLAFIEARERGEELSGWLERYPEHADVLIDLAIALDMEPDLDYRSPSEIARATDILKRAFGVATTPPSDPAPGLVARARGVGLKIPQLAEMGERRRMRCASRE